jgi:DNA (cytosine-5)-methyltransferase 1
MTMAAYYNEFDRNAAQWLRNLIAAGHIAPGDVDDRDIRDVKPSDLAGYTQCHFFAGIGVWSGAFRLAGIADSYPAWTASCPCTPFSAAGKRLGKADERHLWPWVANLIFECRPRIVFGEQVASSDGLDWLDDVLDDLQIAGYTAGAQDSCAAGVGAPHIRQRLYWTAIDPYASRQDGASAVRLAGRTAGIAGGAADEGRMADANIVRPELPVSESRPAKREAGELLVGRSVSVGLADGHKQRTGETDGFWKNPDWLRCRDDKWRPVEAGTFTLAHGNSNRVGRLRAYGNAIVMPQASQFLRSIIDFAEGI